MHDSYYKKGLEKLASCVKNDPDAKSEFSIQQDRLRRNLKNERYGSSENNRMERAQIIGSLNDIAMRYCQGKTFIELCEGDGSEITSSPPAPAPSPDPAPPPAPAPDPPPGVLGRIVRFFKNLHKNNVVVFWLTVIATIATVIGAIAAVIAIIPDPKPPLPTQTETPTSGNGEHPAPTLPLSPPPPQATPTINELVDLLLECPSMKDRGTRDAIVGQLDYDDTINRHSTNKTDVMNIVRAGTAYPDGIEDLIEAVRFHDKETTCMYDIDEFLNASPTPDDPSASPATPTPAPFKVVIADFENDVDSIPDDIYDYLDIQFFNEMGFKKDEIVLERYYKTVSGRADASTVVSNEKAMLLIWGEVRRGEVEPRFYVSDVLDLDGSWKAYDKWGRTPIAFTDPSELEGTLKERTEVLALFVKGMTLIYSKEYPRARFTFDEAIKKIPGGVQCNGTVNGEKNQGQWDGINNLLLLYKARSLVSTKEELYEEGGKNRDDALDCLDQVIVFDQGYSWAYIHRGNVFLGEADERTDDEASIFLAVLNLARVEYERALQTNDEDTERFEQYVPFKAHINIAATYYYEAVYHYRNENKFEEQARKAIEHNQWIIEQGNEGESVPELYLANAYYGLANIYRLQGKPDEARESYDECITAAGSSDDPRAEPLQAECENWRDRPTDDMGDG